MYYQAFNEYNPDYEGVSKDDLRKVLKALLACEPPEGSRTTKLAKIAQNKIEQDK